MQKINLDLNLIPYIKKKTHKTDHRYKFKTLNDKTFIRNHRRNFLRPVVRQRDQL